MKLTVLSILILIFVAGLAMIQMDANTENQIQVTENQIQLLRETEMFTTQGLGLCEYLVKRPDETGNCGNISCKKVEGSSVVYHDQTAVAYNKCTGFNPRNVRDCFPRVRSDGITPAMQICANVDVYVRTNNSSQDAKKSDCHDDFYFTSYAIRVQDVYDTIGCDWKPSGGGGYVPVGGTSS